MKDSLFRDPAWCMGTLVWFSATLIFPMRLGWSGAGVLALGAYLPVAVSLLLAADVMYNRTYYGSWRELQVQFALFLLGILAPATIAFGVGHLGSLAAGDPAGVIALEAVPTDPWLDPST